MAGRRQHPVRGIPVSIKSTEKEGYLLLVEITEGPNDLLYRRLGVRFTVDQLSRVAQWDPEKEWCLDIREYKVGGVS